MEWKSITRQRKEGEKERESKKRTRIEIFCRHSKIRYASYSSCTKIDFFFKYRGCIHVCTHLHRLITIVLKNKMHISVCLRMWRIIKKKTSAGRICVPLFEIWGCNCACMYDFSCENRPHRRRITKLKRLKEKKYIKKWKWKTKHTKE